MEPARRGGHKEGMNLSSGEPSDEDLWRDALEGSADAWDALFVRYHRAIYNFCFRRTGLWSAAEDLTSAVFLEAWRRRTQIRPQVASALPWLYGIATMLTRNHHRTLRRYRDALDRIPLPESAGDPAEEVAARVDAERQVARLRVALRQLPRQDRDVLELAATGQLSHAEIAAALGIPIGTVKSRLSRARQRLGEHVDRVAREDAGENARHSGVGRPSLPGIRPRRY
jgi:RNA polymerase sigma-70 factor (ECF subfamily)